MIIAFGHGAILRLSLDLTVLAWGSFGEGCRLLLGVRAKSKQ